MKAQNTLKRCTKMKIVMMLFVVSFASALFSQNDQPAFAARIRGLGEVVDAIQTSDGGYVTLSERRSGLHIVRKTSASGERVWEKSLSVQIVGLYNLTSITEVSNGFIIAGYKWNVWDYDNYPFALIIFLRADGTIKGNKVFYENGRAISFDYVTPSPDGGFIVTGTINPPHHLILVKFTSSGHILWAKGFDNSNFLSEYVSHPSPDNGLVLASSIQTENLLVGANLVKVDQSGRTVWRRTVNLGPHSSITLGHTLRNGTLLAANPVGTNILTLVALKANGKLAWSANYSLDVSAFSISSVIPTQDHGYVVTGTFINKTGEARDGFLIKIDARRNVVLKQAFGYPGSQDRSQAVFARNANRYFLLGSSNTDLLFLNLNSKGVGAGCNFFHKLSARRLDSPEITIGTPTITESSPTLPAASTTQVTMGDSRRRSITICQKSGQ